MEEAKDVCKRVKGDGSRTKTVSAGMKTRRNSLSVIFPFLSPSPCSFAKEKQGTGFCEESKIGKLPKMFDDEPME